MAIMMTNHDPTATWQYHNATKHSEARLRASRHFLDWNNKPIPYKIYSSLPAMPLPRDFPPSSVTALDAIATAAPSDGQRIPDLSTLARLCLFSNGITKTLRFASGEMPFRAAATTGALYHVELYLVCADLPDLAAGVYHYGAHDHTLRQLRSGDYRQALVEATAAEPSVTNAPVVVISTSTFWRNAWKYQARAYRHSFWDNGTLLANFLAVATAQELPARVVLGFADDAVNRLVDVDPEHEAATGLVALGHVAGSPPRAPEVVPLGLPTVPLSAHEVKYPAIESMHAASSLESGAEAASWRGTLSARPAVTPQVSLVPLQPLDESVLPTTSIETVIRRRGSSRRFTHEPLDYAQLSTMLARATSPISADFLGPDAEHLSDAYLIANAIEGLGSGTYVFRRQPGALETLKSGHFRDQAGYLALGQNLGADAAVNVYFLADLSPVLERFGNRGYRTAQLDAAIMAGRLYLAAYALRLGATGLTFFDDDVTDFFSPHAAGKSVMFLIALGHPAKRRP